MKEVERASPALDGNDCVGWLSTDRWIALQPQVLKPIKGTIEFAIVGNAPIDGIYCTSNEHSGAALGARQNH